MNVDVQINGPDMLLSADRALNLAVKAVANTALRNCNYYCKHDSKALKARPLSIRIWAAQS